MGRAAPRASGRSDRQRAFRSPASLLLGEVLRHVPGTLLAICLPAPSPRLWRGAPICNCKLSSLSLHVRASGSSDGWKGLSRSQRAWLVFHMAQNTRRSQSWRAWRAGTSWDCCGGSQAVGGALLVARLQLDLGLTPGLTPDHPGLHQADPSPGAHADHLTCVKC